MTRPFWKIITILIAVIIVIVAIGLFALTAPEREVAKNPFMNAISQQTNEWDVRVDLTPTPLEIGTSLEEVESLLQASFFHQSDRKYLKPYVLEPGPPKPTASFKESGEIVFSLDHGNFVCNKEYVVFLKFDGSPS